MKNTSVPHKVALMQMYGTSDCNSFSDFTVGQNCTHELSEYSHSSGIYLEVYLNFPASFLCCTAGLS